MPKEETLQAIANRLRRNVLQMTTIAGSGHPTTCLSMAELMACLFFDEMKFNVKNYADLANDEFVLSKGHASPILWAAYAEAGIIPFKKLQEYRQYASPLEGHPTPNMPWVKVATGSLGQGLAAAVGMVLANKIHSIPSRVFVMLGDGECAEGSVWEAAGLAGKWKLNLTAIVDCNRLGQSGESLHGLNVNEWKQKFMAFDWSVQMINGHDVHEVLKALAIARATKGPSVILAKTVKGKGVSFLEDKEGWHGKALSPEQLAQALAELPNERVDARKLIRAPSKLRIPVMKQGKVQQPLCTQGEMVATRNAFGDMLEKLGADERIVVLDGDVKNSTFTDLFFKQYPDRSIECFIAEQTMVGIATGLAARGLLPVCATFAAFFTRAHDQIRMAALSRANIVFCGSHCGVSIGEDGPSQMGLEDLALFRCLPRSIVLYPCDAVSAEKLTEIAVRQKGITYLRTTRPKTQVIYKNNEKFTVGGSKMLRQSSKDKVVIIAAGVTVHEALKAADELGNVRVIDAYSVKPLDERAIRSAAKKRKVIVVEDHYAQGGLGEAVAALGIPITHLCIKDSPRSGKPQDLMRVYGIDAKAIKKAASRTL